MKRVQPRKPWSMMQKLVAILVGRGHRYNEIATRLSIAPTTVKYYAEEAARRLPGDLPPKWRLVFWWRGATEEQLEGTAAIGENRLPPR